MGLVLPVVGNGVVVDRLVAADAPMLAASHSDPDNARLQLWQFPLSEQQALEFIADQQEGAVLAVGSGVQLAIRERVAGPLVGDLYLARPADDGSGPADAPEAELGITLVPGAHSRGLATAAVRAVLEAVGRAPLPGLERMAAWADTGNHRSIALLERCGFRPDGAPPSPCTRRDGTPAEEVRLVVPF